MSEPASRALFVRPKFLTADPSLAPSPRSVPWLVPGRWPAFAQWPRAARWAVYYLALLGAGFAGQQATRFIYLQF